MDKVSEVNRKNAEKAMVGAFIAAMVLLTASSSVYALEKKKTLVQTGKATESNNKECLEETSRQGWFWYCYEPPAQETDDNRDLGEKPKPGRPDLSSYSHEKLWNMHPDEFSVLLKDFRKKAVMTLETKDVEDYLYVQDIARRKSLAFTNVVMYTQQVNPSLSVSPDYPTAAPGRRAMTRQKVADVSTEIVSARENHGLVYFYSRKCPYCVEQSGILRFFQDKYGWEITGVDIDLTPRAAVRFNVQRVPHLILVSREKEDYIPIATGVVSLADLEKRLYRAIRLLTGEVSPMDWTLYDYQRGGAFDVTSHTYPFSQ